MSRYDDEFGDSTVAPPSSLVYFTVGLVAGAAIALLVAPATGRDTRANLKRGTATLKQKTRQLADDVRTRGRDTWNEQSARVNNAVQQGYSQASALGEQLGEALEEGKAAYRDVRNRAQSFMERDRSETA
jgi:gas vesicle protein